MDFNPPYMFIGHNVNDLLPKVVEELVKQPVAPSRNGNVHKFSAPVTICYERPQERVLFYPKRDANPFFHLAESLWMLAGRNDLPFLAKFVKRMSSFSDDDGATQPGAYGHRWRNHFEQDQLTWAVNRLKADPHDRRVVIQMYDANTDQRAADNGGKDIPCNLMALPSVRGDKLDLTVFNRSNDTVWGALGANAVHFSVLQEFLAFAVGCNVGQYYQISNNLHGYLDTIDKGRVEYNDPYQYKVYPKAMFNQGFRVEEFYDDLDMFLDDPTRTGVRNDFLRKIACPMMMAHKAYKLGDREAAVEIVTTQMPETNDWRKGAEIWLNNRKK